MIIIRATTLKMVPLEKGVMRVPLRKLEHGPGHEAISVSNTWTYSKPHQAGNPGGRFEKAQQT